MHTSTVDEVDLRLRVDRRTTGAEGVVVLDLRADDGTELPGWAAGAHVDLRLPGGLTRQYSLCGNPADRAVWRVAVLREPESRGGSAHVHEALVEGAEVEVRGVVPRCAVVDLDPDTGARRSPVLKALGVYRHLHGEVVFGVDAVVTQPGRVRPGVPVDIVGRS